MLDKVLAAAVLAIHLLYILWVMFGALFTRGRPVLAALHVLSMIWGVLIEVLPWTCPLTWAENWLEARAGVAPYSGGFLLHYLDAIVYPNIPPLVLEIAAVVVFAINLAVYGRRLVRARASG